METDISFTTSLERPTYSEWRCHLFGSSGMGGITWRPVKGQEPNRFWRFMQYVCFGNRWVRDAN
jgi:hypothetical protein